MDGDRGSRAQRRVCAPPPCEGVNVITLLLVDDHAVVRAGLRALFSTVPRFLVVGEASTAVEAVAEARRCQPDVVLLDLRLPDGSGVDACRQMLVDRPETRVIILSSYSDDESVVASIMAGAAGYLLKHVEPARLIDAVERVARGESVLDPPITHTILHWMRQVGPRSEPDPLSAQQRRILSLIAEGKTNREIAACVYLSENTVRTYVSHILHKLHLARRAEAAAFIARRQPAER